MLRHIWFSNFTLLLYVGDMEYLTILIYLKGFIPLDVVALFFILFLVYMWPGVA
jgi:hypothetical protein